MQIQKSSSLLALSCAVFATASACLAGSPYVIDVTTSGAGAPPEIVIAESNLKHFVNDLIDAQGQYAAIAGFAYAEKTTYLGVGSAFTFTGDAPGTTVTLAVPLIGFSQTFTGPTRDDVQQQIKTFIKQNGSNVWAAFLSAIAKQSPNAVTDGNPNATTGAMANSTFQAEGFTPVDEILPEEPGTSPHLSGFGLGFDAGQFTAGGLSGQLVDFAIPVRWKLSDKVGLTLNIPFSYLTLEGAKVYGTGFNLALPIRFETMSADKPWNWRVTPLLGAAARASEDLGSGAALWQVGLSNSVDYRVNPKLIVCMVNQLTDYHSFKVTFGGYSFDPEIKQQILKDGFRVVSPLTQRLIGSIFLLDSRFLKDAAVKQFTTIGASLALRATKKMNVQFGGNYDTGTDFKSWTIGLSSAWKY
ncbi:MAG TPA: hypothetical protein VLW52_03220 [Opitutaceae bacterium]|nr:hypothetical protein [Opitutaceae bacterium]